MRSLFLAKINEKDACFRVPQSSYLPQSCAKEKSSGVEIDIMPDEDFKSDISSLKKRPEHDFVRALVKFHPRRVEKLTIKLRKLEQARKHNRNDMEFTKNVKPVATVQNRAT